MAKGLTAAVSIEFKTDQASVWKGLTDPAIIKQYFFGTNVECDWKKGSPIFFRGEWEGKTYEDKGTVLDINPGTYLKYSYWSSMSGTADIPENYVDVSYSLSHKDGITTLTVKQEGIKTEESMKHSMDNWTMVFDGLKKLIEK